MHEAKQTAAAMSFFMHMYWSAAESMATKLLGCLLVMVFLFPQQVDKTIFYMLNESTLWVAIFDFFLQHNEV